MSCKTVKTSLKSILLPGLVSERFLAILQPLLIKINNLVIDTYQLVRLYCLRQFHINGEQPTINGTFVHACIAALIINIRSNTHHKNDSSDNNDDDDDNDNITNWQEIMHQFYVQEYQPIFNHQPYDLPCASQIFKYLQISITTCLNNNLKEHYYTRLQRFINISAGQYYDQHQFALNLDVTRVEYNQDKWRALNELKKTINNGLYHEIPALFVKWLQPHRINLLPSDDHILKKGTIAYDCHATPSLYIASSLYINQQFELMNVEANMQQPSPKLIKLYQPLSLRTSNIPHYITLDTTTLNLLFMPAEHKRKYQGQVKVKQVEIWSTFFDLDKHVFGSFSKHHTFNFIIQTDGVGCSICFQDNQQMAHKRGGSKKKQRPQQQQQQQEIEFKTKTMDVDVEMKEPVEIETIKIKKTKIHKTGVEEPFSSMKYFNEQLSMDELAQLQGKRLVAADPGKYNLVCMSDHSSQEHMKKDTYSVKHYTRLRYTQPQRRVETGAKRNTEIMLQMKQSRIIDEETKLSQVCGKTVDYKRFKQYIKLKHDINTTVQPFYTNPVCRKMKWRQRILTQQSEIKFLNQIEKTFGPAKDMVILYGNWSRTTQMAGLPPTLGKGLLKKISKRYTTLLIDEYNTSKLCSRCHAELKHAPIAEKKRAKKEAELKLKLQNSSNSNSSKSIPANITEFRLLYCPQCRLERDQLEIKVQPSLQTKNNTSSSSYKSNHVNAKLKQHIKRIAKETKHQTKLQKRQVQEIKWKQKQKQKEEKPPDTAPPPLLKKKKKEKKARIIDTNIGSFQSKIPPMYVHRDLNACFNMLFIAQHIMTHNMMRPLEYSRQKIDRDDNDDSNTKTKKRKRKTSNKNKNCNPKLVLQCS